MENQNQSSGIQSLLIQLGDNSMILGHRLSELCGHGPSLETDIALTNISLDLFGQVRNYFQYAAKLRNDGTTEDDIAFLRYEREYRNALLVEQPNKDFAYVIVRQFLFDSFHLPLLEELVNHPDSQIKAIAEKSIKEVRYHLRFSSSWMIRLGDGTEESRKRIQSALLYLSAYTDELTASVDPYLLEVGLGGADTVKRKQMAHIKSTLDEANLELPDVIQQMPTGSKGIHSEHFGYILSDLQFMQRNYPKMTW